MANKYWLAYQYLAVSDAHINLQCRLLCITMKACSYWKILIDLMIIWNVRRFTVMKVMFLVNLRLIDFIASSIICYDVIHWLAIYVMYYLWCIHLWHESFLVLHIRADAEDLIMIHTSNKIEQWLNHTIVTKMWILTRLHSPLCRSIKLLSVYVLMLFLYFPPSMCISLDFKF